MGKHETGRDLHEEGQSREARKRGGAAPPWRTHRKRKCPTFPSGGAQWDEREKKFLKINAEKEGWCPGAELNHRHTDFQSVALPTELPGHGGGLIEMGARPVQRIAGSGSRPINAAGLGSRRSAISRYGGTARTADRRTRHPRARQRACPRH